MAGMTRHRAWKTAALWALFIALALSVTLPALMRIHWWGVHDWPQFYVYFGVPERAVSEYGELPGWNPYYYGGNVQWGHPDDPTLSPVFICLLLFGVVGGTKIAIVLTLAAGMYSMWLLARKMEVSVLAALFAAVVWGLNGWHAYHFAVGHMDHLTFLLQPLVVFFLLKGCDNRRWAVAGGGVMALMFLSGGPYPFIFTSILVVVLSLLLAGFRNNAAPLKAAAGILLFASGFAAVKLLATAEFMLFSPGVEADVTGISVATLWNGLFDSRIPMVVPYAMTKYGSWEYAAFIGYVPAACFVAGAVAAARRMWPWLVVAVVFLIASLGSTSPINFFSLFTAPPGLSGMHVPFRFVVHFIMAVALIGAVGIDAICGLVRKTRLKAVAVLPAAAILLATAASLIWMHYNRPVSLYRLASYFVPPKAYGGEVQPEDESQRLSRGEQRFVPQTYQQTLRVYRAFLDGTRLSWGYDAVHLRKAATFPDEHGYRGEAYFARPASGTIVAIQNTLSSYSVSYEAVEQGIIVLNQNYYPGWKVKGASGEAFEMGGVVAANVAAGSGTVTFFFDPSGRNWGALLTMFTVVIAFFFVRSHRETEVAAKSGERADTTEQQSS